MAYKDRIYDITAWDMATRLELFLNDSCGTDGKGGIKRTDENGHIFDKCFGRPSRQTLGEKINFFNEHKPKEGSVGDYQKICNMMKKIHDKRNRMAHPKNLAPILSRDEFKILQESCFKLEGKIKSFCKQEKVRIRDVLPTLEYDMGNAGDIIKHGLLVEFIGWLGKWWVKENPDRILQIADTFAGCPWDNMFAKSKARACLKQLKKTNLSIIQRESQITDAYMGSSFLMLAAAIKNEIPVHIDVSDKDEDARCNWDNATIGHKDRHKKSIKLIDLPPENDGYKILEPPHPEKYDLIFLDPYSDFLRDEFYWADKRGYKPGYFPKKTKYFSKILELVKNHPNLFIAVFVLDMDSKNEVGKNYADFKRDKLNGLAFSIRCPKTPREKTQISGETRGKTGFNSEILLISQQIADGKCDELCTRLGVFAYAANEALPLPDGKKVEFKVL